MLRFRSLRQLICPSRCQSARPLSMTAEQVRQSLGEGAVRAGRTAAVEAPDRQPQSDRFAADRQIGRLSAVATVDGGAESAASGTAGGIATRFGGDQEGVGTVTHHTKDAAAGQLAEQGHALICELAPTSTGRGRQSRVHQTRRRARKVVRPEV